MYIQYSSLYSIPFPNHPNFLFYFFNLIKLRFFFNPPNNNYRSGVSASRCAAELISVTVPPSSPTFAFHFTVSAVTLS